MNRQTQMILETDDLTQAGQAILSYLKIVGTDGRWGMTPFMAIKYHIG